MFVVPLVRGPWAKNIGIRVFSNVNSEMLVVQSYPETTMETWNVETTSPQQGDLRLSGPPSGQGAGSGARTRNRRVPADLRADSQATVLPTPPLQWYDEL
ncbi:hypothetical protein PoB_002108900 [Plakobranchus ocellatus]|uniref:Uncharacterized protein n=1 Tax=Plakobranchus ocellatus TaxID=259542 RepID=A0AAV3ZL29_9GAST|nr:hypothetical protein PoB_002108900 [Plakobranchus ocellatus]